MAIVSIDRTSPWCHSCALKTANSITTTGAARSWMWSQNGIKQPVAPSWSWHVSSRFLLNRSAGGKVIHFRCSKPWRSHSAFIRWKSPTRFVSLVVMSTFVLCLIEKLFEIARRVPFLAMTIIEKKSLDSPWFFRAEPLQTTSTRSSRELATEIISPMTIPPLPIQNYSTESYGQIGQSRQQSPNGQVRLPNGPILIDPKKIGKSSTEPNMPISHSRSRMFRVV